MYSAATVSVIAGIWCDSSNIIVIWASVIHRKFLPRLRIIPIIGATKVHHVEDASEAVNIELRMMR